MNGLPWGAPLVFAARHVRGSGAALVSREGRANTTARKTPYRPTIDPGSTQKRSRIDPESMRNGHRINTESMQNRSRINPG